MGGCKCTVGRSISRRGWGERKKGKRKEEEDNERRQGKCCGKQRLCISIIISNMLCLVKDVGYTGGGVCDTHVCICVGVFSSVCFHMTVSPHV